MIRLRLPLLGQTMTLVDPNADGQFVAIEHHGDDNLVLGSVDVVVGPFYSIPCSNPDENAPLDVPLGQTVRLRCKGRMQV